jgi:hypothetical protein
MSWMRPEPESSADFFVYESAVNKIVEDKPAIFMCMYDLERFGVSMLVDVLKTHPKVLLDRMVLENPHYLTSERFLEGDQHGSLANDLSAGEGAQGAYGWQGRKIPGGR